MEQHLSLFYVLSFLTAVIAFAYAAYLYLWVKKQQENERGHNSGEDGQHLVFPAHEGIGALLDQLSHFGNTQITVVSLVASLLSSLFVAFSFFG